MHSTKATIPGYQHLGTVKAGLTEVSIGLICPQTPGAVFAAPDAVFAGYTREQLEAAYALVKPAGHWKNPIDATIEADGDVRAAVHAAVAFFTGSDTMVEPQPDGRVRFTAPGYYATIGA